MTSPFSSLLHPPPSVASPPSSSAAVATPPPAAAPAAALRPSALGLPQHSVQYLKSYPYLFVRETDQSHYFCTLCESYLKQEQLHSHLFQDHSARGVQDFFVKVSTPQLGGAGKRKAQAGASVHVCVICWAKLVKWEDAVGHRYGEGALISVGV